MADRLVLGVFLCGDRPQVSLTRQDENGAGGGYRLLGPSFNGTSELLQGKVLSERDAAEVRRMLDAVFPVKPAEPDNGQPLTCVRCWNSPAARLLVIHWREETIRMLCGDCAAVDAEEARDLPGFRMATLLTIGTVQAVSGT